MKGFFSDDGRFAFIQPKLGGSVRLVVTDAACEVMQFDGRLPSETVARRFLVGLDASWTEADGKTTREMARRLRGNAARR